MSFSGFLTFLVILTPFIALLAAAYIASARMNSQVEMVLSRMRVHQAVNTERIYRLERKFEAVVIPALQRPQPQPELSRLVKGASRSRKRKLSQTNEGVSLVEPKSAYKGLTYREILKLTD